MKHCLMAASLLLAASCNIKTEKRETSSTGPQATALASDQQVKRGAYLVGIIGCGDCHTPKKMTPKGPAPDMDRFLSGYPSANPLGDYDTAVTRTGRWVQFTGDLTATAGPWGVSFAANLTPDPTGLGNWSLENFKMAMQHGKYKGIEASRDLLPPMPWQNFATMADEDLAAVFAYLKTIKPIENRVPAAISPRS